jgi:beta-glucanase (GH16 family)
MTKRCNCFKWLGLLLATSLVPLSISVVGAAAPWPVAKRPSPGGQSGSAWTDDFSGRQIDKKRWVIASGQAPGHIVDYHMGTYEPGHVQLVKQGTNAFLELLLTQETGQVDTNPSGTISKGALLYTKNQYGYGTYEWRMRMSSTAATPSGVGNSVSGSVSAGFVYVNNSETEIDFEFSALDPGTLYMVNWLNSDPQTDPTEADETYDTINLSSVSTTFHDYKFVWEATQISFYVDGVLQAVHTDNIPSAPAHFMINHWGTDSGLWGGSATVGVDRYFYVDWVKYTPLQ